MGYILTGVLGFSVGYSFELLALKRVRGGKPLIGMVAGGLLAYSTVMVCLDTGRFELPFWIQSVGWFLLPFSGLLLAYSLFLELPFSRTHRTVGPAPELVTTGTYALVRHPTVPWYALVLFSLLLVSRSTLLLLAMPLWLALDVLWVVLQERLLLSKAFPEYEAYRRTTPMLIPTRRSLRASLGSLRRADISSRGSQGE